MSIEKEEEFKRKGYGFLKTLGIFIVFIIIASLIYNMFTYRVYESEQSVVTRFGEVKKIVVSNKNSDLNNEIKEHAKLSEVVIVERKGLHFKVPFIDNVQYFSDRLLTYDTNPREVTTLDKKKLILDNYAQWKISNPAVFKVSMKNERNAHTRLDDLIYSNLNKEIGRTNAHDIISNVEKGEKILVDVMKSVNEDIRQYGMQVVDVRIRRTELPKENYESVYGRMETERQRQATKYTSEGKEEAQKIRSQADKEATVIEANAYEKAETIKGQGDAEALKIYAEAYNGDPEFYQFYRSLEAYKKLIDSNTKIVIPAKSELAKYLFNK